MRIERVLDHSRVRLDYKAHPNLREGVERSLGHARHGTLNEVQTLMCCLFHAPRMAPGDYVSARQDQLHTLSPSQELAFRGFAYSVLEAVQLGDLDESSTVTLDI